MKKILILTDKEDAHGRLADAGVMKAVVAILALSRPPPYQAVQPDMDKRRGFGPRRFPACCPRRGGERPFPLPCRGHARPSRGAG